MFVIIGIVIVIGAILGGYLMEHGNIRVLLAAGGTGDHRGSVAGNGLDCQPSAYA